MPTVEEYRRTLRTLAEWEPFLLAESRLPGPRANLELIHAAADLADEALLERFAAVEASADSPRLFLLLCGTVGLGRLLAQGRTSPLPTLRRLADDGRWRLREAVAMALQRWGAADMPALLAEMRAWAQGTPLEQRAAVAALCEPALLREPAHALAVLDLLHTVTASIPRAAQRQGEPFRALRQTLGYGWSVAVAALPSEGRRRMEHWLPHHDRDIRWIMRENLRKNRLARLDPAWVARCQERLSLPG
ncbi:MAG: hypothetical protein GX605_14255 [Chloroflexi bacterium]|nr:hypothetical protein [Chloroflexota bacterium]